mmetsp:Transcript_14955/g.50147  ORF Transcript_14955/g.50147 Transcript_14955/m.50147 type:complete len:263 (-) Transcript_14955:71-859(-)
MRLTSRSSRARAVGRTHFQAIVKSMLRKHRSSQNFCAIMSAQSRYRRHVRVSGLRYGWYERMRISKINAMTLHSSVYWHMRAMSTKNSLMLCIVAAAPTSQAKTSSGLGLPGVGMLGWPPAASAGSVSPIINSSSAEMPRKSCGVLDCASSSLLSSPCCRPMREAQTASRSPSAVSFCSGCAGAAAAWPLPSLRRFVSHAASSGRFRDRADPGEPSSSPPSSGRGAGRAEAFVILGVSAIESSRSHCETLPSSSRSCSHAAS